MLDVTVYNNGDENISFNVTNITVGMTTAMPITSTVLLDQDVSDTLQTGSSKQYNNIKIDLRPYQEMIESSTSTFLLMISVYYAKPSGYEDYSYGYNSSDNYATFNGVNMTRNVRSASMTNRTLISFTGINSLVARFYNSLKLALQSYTIDNQTVTSGMGFNNPHYNVTVPCIKGKKLIIDGYFTWTARNTFANVLFNLCDGVTNGFNMMLDTRQDTLIYSWSTIIGGHEIPNCFNTVGASTTETIQLNKEYHVRYEYDGSTMRTYLNGAIGRTQTNADFPTTENQLRIYLGGSVNTSNGRTSGKLRDVKIMWGV